MGFLLTTGFGIAGNYAWEMVLFTAVAIGLYFPLSLISIATWRTTREKSGEDMITVFGPNAPEITSSFQKVYLQNKTVVLGTTVLTWLGSGGLIGLWFALALPGAWQLNPSLLLILTAGGSLCGAIAGPGLAISVLFFLRSKPPDSNALKK